MSNFLKKFSLTKREQIIIGFLAVCFLGGLAVKYSGWKKPNDYNYSPADKQFNEQVKTAFGELEKNKLSEEQQYKSDELKNFSDSLLTEGERESLNRKQVPPDKKININTAYAPDLQLLPGIGEVIAERIIDYREQKGGFKKAEDIMKVHGIGDKKFEQIKDFIVVE